MMMMMMTMMMTATGVILAFKNLFEHIISEGNQEVDIMLYVFKRVSPGIPDISGPITQTNTKLSMYE